MKLFNRLYPSVFWQLWLGAFHFLLQISFSSTHLPPPSSPSPCSNTALANSFLTLKIAESTRFSKPGVWSGKVCTRHMQKLMTRRRLSRAGCIFWAAGLEPTGKSKTLTSNERFSFCLFGFVKRYRKKNKYLLFFGITLKTVLQLFVLSKNLSNTRCSLSNNQLQTRWFVQF